MGGGTGVLTYRAMQVRNAFSSLSWLARAKLLESILVPLILQLSTSFGKAECTRARSKLSRIRFGHWHGGWDSGKGTLHVRHITNRSRPARWGWRALRQNGGQEESGRRENARGREGLI